MFSHAGSFLSVHPCFLYAVLLWRLRLSCCYTCVRFVVKSLSILFRDIYVHVRVIVQSREPLDNP